MNAKQVLIGFGTIVFGVVLLCITGAALTLGSTAVYLGLVWMSSKLLPLLSLLTFFLLAVIVCILLPMAIPRVTRVYSGMALGWIAVVFFVTLWMDSLLITLQAWGFIAGMIGLLTFVGVIPMAILVTLLNGMWFRFGELIVLLMITMFCWVVGALFQGSSLRGE